MTLSNVVRERIHESRLEVDSIAMVSAKLVCGILDVTNAGGCSGPHNVNHNSGSALC